MEHKQVLVEKVLLIGRQVLKQQTLQQHQEKDIFVIQVVEHLL